MIIKKDFLKKLEQNVIPFDKNTFVLKNEFFQNFNPQEITELFDKSLITKENFFSELESIIDSLSKEEVYFFYLNSKLFFYSKKEIEYSLEEKENLLYLIKEVEIKNDELYSHYLNENLYYNILIDNLRNDYDLFLDFVAQLKKIYKQVTFHYITLAAAVLVVYIQNKYKKNIPVISKNEIEKNTKEVAIEEKLYFDKVLGEYNFETKILYELRLEIENPDEYVLNKIDEINLTFEKNENEIVLKFKSEIPLASVKVLIHNVKKNNNLILFFNFFENKFKNKILKKFEYLKSKKENYIVLNEQTNILTLEKFDKRFENKKISELYFDSEKEKKNNLFILYQLIKSELNSEDHNKIIQICLEKIPKNYLAIEKSFFLENLNIYKKLLSIYDYLNSILDKLKFEIKMNQELLDAAKKDYEQVIKLLQPDQLVVSALNIQEKLSQLIAEVSSLKTIIKDEMKELTTAIVIGSKEIAISIQNISINTVDSSKSTTTKAVSTESKKSTQTQSTSKENETRIQPVETQPVETQPVERTQPVEKTQPVETQPVEKTQPVETQPVEIQPVETQPVETQPIVEVSTPPVKAVEKPLSPSILVPSTRDPITNRIKISLTRDEALLGFDIVWHPVQNAVGYEILYSRQLPVNSRVMPDANIFRVTTTRVSLNKETGIGGLIPAEGKISYYFVVAAVSETDELSDFSEVIEVEFNGGSGFSSDLPDGRPRYESPDERENPYRIPGALNDQDMIGNY